jgi:hypothetical protein
VDLSSLTYRQMAALAGAIEQKALLLCIGGAPYAAVHEEPGWWVWELGGDAEYAIDHALTKCTCPVSVDCKHIRALKGPAIDTTLIPWRAERHVRKGRRRPNR